MSVSKYVDHLLVLPEDDANTKVLNGFVLHDTINSRLVHVLPEAGGWRHVLDEFEEIHVKELRIYPKRRMLLLIDFDEKENRRQEAEARIPADIQERVFLIGTWAEPEKLRTALGRSLEEIGRALAEDCFRNTTTTWSHPLLQHNTDELVRLREQVHPFLFN